MRALVALSAAILCAPQLVAAQGPATIRGRVVDAASGAPIGAARVELSGQSTQTASDGRFGLGGLAAGAALLVVTAIGYRPSREQIDLPAGLELERTVRLVATAPVLPDITIRASADSGATLDHRPSCGGAPTSPPPSMGGRAWWYGAAAGTARRRPRCGGARPRK